MVAVALSVAAVAMWLRPAGTAHADSWQNCSPGQSLSSYRANGCAYGSVGYTQVGDDDVYVPVWISPCGYAGANAFPSNIVSDIQRALNNWTGSSADVTMWQVSTGGNCTPPSNTNLLKAYPDKNDFPSNSTCGGNNPWGYGWDGGSGNRGQILLNAYLFGCNDNGWTGLVAHEMGHDMGLSHNNYGNCSQLMCASFIQVTGPQNADTSIFNAMYPYHSASCPSAPGNNNCNNTDYIQQGCNHYPQSGGYSSAYLSVTLNYSTNCQANFTWAQIKSGGYVLTKVDIERGANSTQWPAKTLTDTPGTSSWYTNSIWSLNNPARGCAWYALPGGGQTYGPFCTQWV
jgi:hypothetical protein